MEPSNDSPETPEPETGEKAGEPASAGAGEKILAEAEDRVVTLPEPAPQPDLEDQPLDDLTPQFRMFDRMCVVFTVLLAVLLASFPARNSDLWMHLGTGQALANGTYTFGQHPFNYAEEGSYWVNHSWLADLLGYWIYLGFGGAALVALKAVLLGLLAVLMIRLSRLHVPRETLLWFPAFCTLLAVMSLGTWLNLRPTVVSYLFLPLTLLFLETGTKRILRGDFGSADLQGKSLLLAVKAFWPILLLFVFWVNMDAWFLLGPLTVGLYWVGRGLLTKNNTGSEGTKAIPALASILGLVLVLGLAACLLSPHHIYSFQFPNQPGFSRVAGQMQRDPLWRNIGFSSLSMFYIWPSSGPNAAAIAYWLLLVVGGISFSVNRAGFQWGRLLIWGVFALLSLYQAHMIPFFVVLAAPITAMNLQEARLRRYGLHPDLRGAARASAVAVRPLLFFAGLALLVAAWPGWLQPGFEEIRRWEVEVDPSLKTVALQLGQWRKDNKISDQVHGFNSSLDIANYCAFFNPEEKGLLNASLHGNSDVVEDYLTLRRELVTRVIDPKSPGVYSPSTVKLEKWRDIMRQRKIGYVTLQASRRQMADRAFSQFVFDSEEWTLIYLQGEVAIFAWNDPDWKGKPGPLAGMKLDLEQLAFYSPGEQKAPTQKPVDAFPPPPNWWQVFTQLGPKPSLPRGEALLYLLYFDAHMPKYAVKENRFWNFCQIGGLIGDLASPIPGWQSLGQACFRWDGMAYADVRFLVHYQLFKFGRDDGPAAPLFLAVRSARQAIQENPYDPWGYLLLGQAYVRLNQATKERHWAKQFPWLAEMRDAQALTAFKQAVLLKPDFVDAHLQLVNLYAKLKYFDLMLEHMKEYVKYSVRNGPPPGITSAQFDQDMKTRKQQITAVEGEVKRQEGIFEANSKKLLTAERAEAAFRGGLINKALDILLKGDVNEFGKSGVQLELKLLMQTGQVGKTNAWLRDKDVAEGLPKLLDQQLVDLIHGQMAAISGDYEGADSYFQQLLTAKVQLRDFSKESLSISAAMSLLVGMALINEVDLTPFHSPLGAKHLPLLMDPDRLPSITPLPLSLHSQLTLWPLFQMVNTLQKNSDNNTIRGLLALEVGDIPRAESLFREALTIWQTNSGTPLSYRIDFNGREMAEEYLRIIQEQKKLHNPGQ